MVEHSAAGPDVTFQFEDAAHQRDAALSGMWLFLATEILFFGGLLLLYMLYRHFHPTGTALASRQTEWGIGTANTVLLVTSSAVFSWGLLRAEAGDNRQLFWAALAVMALGTAFLALKAWEWHSDFEKHLFPGPDFALHEPDRGGAQLFWCFYFVVTALHGLHMLIGIVLVGWVAQGARHGRYAPGRTTAVEGVALYWSFVDGVWLVLYPLIYLAGGGLQ